MSSFARSTMNFLKRLFVTVVQMKLVQMALDLRAPRRPAETSNSCVEFSGPQSEIRSKARGPRREHMSMNPRSGLSVRGTQPLPLQIGELMEARARREQARCIAVLLPHMISLAAVLKLLHVPVMR